MQKCKIIEIFFIVSLRYVVVLGNAKKTVFFVPCSVVFKSDNVSEFSSEFALRFVTFVERIVRKVVAAAF